MSVRTRLFVLLVLVVVALASGVRAGPGTLVNMVAIGAFADALLASGFVHDLDARPRVTGVHGRTLPEYDISVAHCAEIAVAVARPHHPAAPGVGIAVAEVPSQVDNRDMSGAEAGLRRTARTQGAQPLTPGSMSC